MATSNWYFVIAAYAAAWTAVVGYWIFVHRSVRRARERFERATSAAPKRGT